MAWGSNCAFCQAAGKLARRLVRLAHRQPGCQLRVIGQAPPLVRAGYCCRHGQGGHDEGFALHGQFNQFSAGRACHVDMHEARHAVAQRQHRVGRRAHVGHRHQARGARRPAEGRHGLAVQAGCLVREGRTILDDDLQVVRAFLDSRRDKGLRLRRLVDGGNLEAVLRAVAARHGGQDAGRPQVSAGGHPQCRALGLGGGQAGGLAEHLELGGHAHAQCVTPRGAVAVGVAVDQARQQRAAPAGNVGGTAWHIQALARPTEGGDAPITHQHIGIGVQGVAVEDRSALHDEGRCQGRGRSGLRPGRH
jgi:hypothetical protein